MSEIPKPSPISSNERKLREKVCCSAPWADAMLAEIQAGKTREQLKEFYPPGGKAETAMQKCPDCGKWCPPNGSKASPCCDCEAAQFWRWALLPYLRRLWWPSAISYTASPTRRPSRSAVG